MIGFLKTGVHTLPTMRLDAERLYLRPARPKDWKAWARLRAESRSFLVPWEPSWPVDALSRGAFVRRLRRQIAEWRQDEGYSFLMFLRADHAVVGGVSLSNVRRGVAQMATLGYWIGERFAHQGLMTEAVLTILDFGFRHLGLHRIEAACLPENRASKGLLLKTGFGEEGVGRAYLRINGAWRDHLLFAIVREEFEGMAGSRAARVADLVEP